ncbi:Tetratricopeptide repeat protein 28 [Bagarius yarrelli]|uniref:Tetratricopeptide repeat protein 28 n=1 Tax=Bagarius yarrelli TaxID=175774 RepID=A0A556U367_BAGYA|nr:Tetratricopeptide repeat protein 28 [Bagarius yarrelli]
MSKTAVQRERQNLAMIVRGLEAQTPAVLIGRLLSSLRLYLNKQFQAQWDDSELSKHQENCVFTFYRTFTAASSALSSLGHVYTAIGDYPNALASHKQCALLAKQRKDQLAEARELGNMGAVYIAMGDFASAVQCHEQHLDIAKVQGDKREEARAYSNLGSAYHYRRDFDKAASYHARVLELAQELQDRAIEMRAYAGLGHAARCMQDLERAKQYHEQQLSIAEGLKDRAAEGRASSNLGKQNYNKNFNKHLKSQPFNSRRYGVRPLKHISFPTSYLFLNACNMGAQNKSSPSYQSVFNLFLSFMVPSGAFLILSPRA